MLMNNGGNGGVLTLVTKVFAGVVTAGFVSLLAWSLITNVTLLSRIAVIGEQVGAIKTTTDRMENRFERIDARIGAIEAQRGGG